MQLGERYSSDAARTFLDTATLDGALLDAASFDTAHLALLLLIYEMQFQYVIEMLMLAANPKQNSLKQNSHGKGLL
ncbi:MAG: hypothetical protein MSC53_05720 [Arcanobacterium sp.]|nr:hypothetical protein [Arcanobacterium sp.]